MTKKSKITTTKKATKQAGAAINTNIKPLVKTALTILTDKATITSGDNIAVAKKLIAAGVAKKIALNDEQLILNAAFNSKHPTARPIFQRTFAPLNLAAHNPRSVSMRDEAFLYAIKTVYGSKPFTHKQCGADSGNMSRAIVLKRIMLAGVNESGETLYKLA